MKRNRAKKKIILILLATFIIGNIIVLSSCVRYPLIVRIRYKNYVAKDTIIFVRKNFKYLEIIHKRCPNHESDCACGSRPFSGSKQRWGIHYEVNKCNAKCKRIWDTLFWQRGFVYVIMVDRWGRRIEEGDFTCPYCEGPFVGKYRAYHKNGRIFTNGRKNGGFRCGEWRFYDRRGDLFRIAQYPENCE